MLIKAKKWFSCLSVVLVMALCAGFFTACGSNPTDLVSNMIQLEFTSAVYSGEEIKPNVTIVVNEETIDSGEYVVVYSNNKDAGSASVKITANEDSSVIKGTVSVGFEILQADAVTTTLDGINAAIANDNYSGVVVSQAFTVNNQETLTVPEGFTVNFGDNILTNNGNIVNNGTIVQNKNILGSGTIENNGEIRAEVAAFPDLKNSFTYANYVKVVADIGAGSTVAENKLDICASAKYKEITIDLNGHTVNRQFRFDSIYGPKTIEVVNTSDSQAVINTRGLLELPAIFLKGDATNTNRTFTVKLSNIKVIGDDIGNDGSKWAAISTNGKFKGEYYNVVAKDCIFDSGDTAGAYLPAGYNYKFENCTFTGNTGYYAKSGKHKLVNCTINGTKNVYSAPKYNGDGADETGSALVLDSAENYNEPLEVMVDGGTFISSNGYAIEEYATSKTGTPNFYSSLEIKGSPKYTSGNGMVAVAVPTFIAKTQMDDAQAVVDTLYREIAEHRVEIGSSKTYTYTEMLEIIEDLQYYVELGTLSYVGEVGKLTIGQTEFIKDQKVKLSIDNNSFIEDKAFYVVDNKLYVAASVLVFETQKSNSIALNGKEFKITLRTNSKRVKVSSVNYLGDGNSATAVEGENNTYDLVIATAGDGDYLELYYTGAETEDKILTRKEIDGVVSYGLTGVEADNGNGNALGLFVVGYYKDFADVPRTKDNTTMNYSFYVLGKGITTLTFNIDLFEVE